MKASKNIKLKKAITVAEESISKLVSGFMTDLTENLEVDGNEVEITIPVDKYKATLESQGLDPDVAEIYQRAEREFIQEIEKASLDEAATLMDDNKNIESVTIVTNLLNGRKHNNRIYQEIKVPDPKESGAFKKDKLISHSYVREPLDEEHMKTIWNQRIALIEKFEDK